MAAKRTQPEDEKLARSAEPRTLAVAQAAARGEPLVAVKALKYDAIHYAPGDEIRLGGAKWDDRLIRSGHVTTRAQAAAARRLEDKAHATDGRMGAQVIAAHEAEAERALEQAQQAAIAAVDEAAANVERAERVLQAAREAVEVGEEAGYQKGEMAHRRGRLAEAERAHAQAVGALGNAKANAPKA